jgi:hypothetical protein
LLHSWIDVPRSGQYGVAWWLPPAKGGLKDSTFWYFLGFQCNSLEWNLALREAGQPECLVYVGVWSPPTRIAEVCDALASPIGLLRRRGFDFEFSENQTGLFLVQRRALDDVLNEEDQRSSILEFFSKSHESMLESGQLLAIRDGHLRYLRSYAGATGADETAEL